MPEPEKLDPAPESQPATTDPAGNVSQVETPSGDKPPSETAPPAEPAPAEKTYTPEQVKSMEKQVGDLRRQVGDQRAYLESLRAQQPASQQPASQQPAQPESPLDAVKFDEYSDPIEALGKIKDAARAEIAVLQQNIAVNEQRNIANMQNEGRQAVTEVQKKYPELNPNSGKYDLDLHEKFGAKFNRVAPTLQSAAEVREAADDIMTVLNKGEIGRQAVDAHERKRKDGEKFDVGAPGTSSHSMPPPSETKYNSPADVEARWREGKIK